MSEESELFVIISFPAGKLVKKETSVTPDPRKGTLSLVQDELGLLHLQWKEREAIDAEDDIVIPPGCGSMERVQKVKDGRVYVLKFPDTKSKHFFWMQDPTDEDDEERCQIINQAIVDSAEYETTEDSMSAGSDGGDGDIQSSEVSNTSGLPDSGVEEPMQTSPAHQRAEPRQSAGNSGASGFSGPITRDSLASMFASIRVPTQLDQGPDLQRVLDPDELDKLFEDPDMFNGLKSLQEFLPEGTSYNEIPELVRCAPFRQFLAKLNYAIKRGYGAEILAPFGIQIPPNEPIGLVSLLKAIAAHKR